MCLVLSFEHLLLFLSPRYCLGCLYCLSFVYISLLYCVIRRVIIWEVELLLLTLTYKPKRSRPHDIPCYYYTTGREIIANKFQKLTGPQERPTKILDSTVVFFFCFFLLTQGYNNFSEIHQAYYGCRVWGVQTSVLLAQCAHAIIMSCVALTWKTYINL